METTNDTNEHFICEVCRKPHYGVRYSDDRCNTATGGFGVSLCEACADKAARLNNNQYARLAVSYFELNEAERNYERTVTMAMTWASLWATLDESRY
jgi:hypothetical protein